MKRLSIAVLALAFASTAALLVGQQPPAPAPAVTAAAATSQATSQATSAPTISEQVVSDGVTVVKLSNGLTVIVKPHRAAPVVAVRCIVRTGSMFEREWLGCGLSHIVEHLTAEDEDEGAADRPKTANSKAAKIGGQYNASTTLDWTQYYISASSGRAIQCVDLIASWMTKLDITVEEFEREHGVVQRELEMGLDSAPRQLYYTHARNLYGSHPAGVPVIGYAAPLAELKYEDVLAYHARAYVPNNMIFVVVGDVDVPAVIERVRQDFAGTKAGRAFDLSLPDVKPITSTRMVVKPMPQMKETMEAISFQAVSMMDEDMYALDMLSTILGDGASSRLYTSVLRDQKLVTAVSAGSSTPAWGKGDFGIHFRCEPGKIDAAEKAILEQIKKIAADGVTADELARAKRETAAAIVRARQSVESIAGMLGMDYMNTGDVAFSASYVKKAQAVTAEQVKAAAQKYLRTDRMIITRLVPQEMFAVDGAKVDSAKAAKATVFTLPNGLRVVLQPVDGAGLVSMALVARGGVFVETAKNNGIGNLMVNLSLKGAGGKTAKEIDEFFANAGGSIGGSCENNTFSWRASTLEDSFDKALGIFADVVTKPAFDAKELEILRPLVLAGIAKIDESPNGAANKLFREKFYGDAPYSRLNVGTEEVVKVATAAQLADYHKNALKAGDAVLAIYGSFDAAAAKAKIEEAFAALPKGKVELPAAAARKIDPAGEQYVLKTKHTGTAVMIGVTGMTLDNWKDRAPIDVMQTIISGWRMPRGWLHTELRGKQLVYSVHAMNWPGLMPGAFLAVAMGQPEKAGEIAAIIQKNFRKATTYTPSKEEIAEAVDTILTSELLGNQSMDNLAFGAAVDELYGFGWDFRTKMEKIYRAVTPEDVLRVAKQYLSQPMVTVITTPKPELVAGAPTTAPAAKIEERK